MKKSREIEKFINKVIFNEQVNLVKQNLPEKELKNNMAYLENPDLYAEIKEAFEENSYLKQRIVLQVEKNKQDLKDGLLPDSILEIDNILVLRTLKLMQENNAKEESQEGYKRANKKICESIVELNHILYISRMQKHIEEFTGDIGLKGSEFKTRGKREIYNAIETMYAKGHKLVLENKLKSFQEKYLDRLKSGLKEMGDESNYNKISEVTEKDGIINGKDYVDALVKLNLEYDLQEHRISKTDKYFINYANELEGNKAGTVANSYLGYTNALVEKKENIFQRIANKIKSIFKRNDDVEIPKDSSYTEPPVKNLKERGSISPKVSINPIAIDDKQKASQEGFRKPIEGMKE